MANQTMLVIRQYSGDVNETILNNKVDKVTGKSLSENDFTTVLKTKLDGVAASATANDTDANLKARANHTGTQSADTLTDGTTNKAFTAVERLKLAGIEEGATVGGAGGDRLQEDIAATTALTPGKDNYDTIAANKTYTHVTTTDGKVTNLYLIVTTECTITLPACRRVGSTGLITGLLVPVGNHELSLKLVDGVWWLADTIGETTETAYSAPVAPTLVSATIDAAGTSLTTVWSEAVSLGASFLAAQTVLTPTGAAVTLSTPTGGGTTTLVQTISRAILQTSEETATFALTQPGDGLEGTVGNLDVVAFSGTAVTNNSTQTAGGGGGTLPVDDDGSGAAQNPLAGIYVTVFGTPQRDGAGAFTLASGTEGKARVDPTQYTFNNDQYAQVTATGGTGTDLQPMGPMVRTQANGSGYFAAYYQPTDIVLLYRADWDGSDYVNTELDRTTGISYGGGELSIKAVGSTITVYIGDIAAPNNVLSFVDATYASGTPGMRLNTGGSITNFKAGNV